MTHSHEESIVKMDVSSLIGIIEESKWIYVREHLSIKLHESQIKLLKNVKKHEKPYHKKIRIEKYSNAEKTDLFLLHEKLYHNKYKKLESKELVKVDETPYNGLKYDVTLTEKGKEILTEISSLEDEWTKVVGITDEDKEMIKNIALNSFDITYVHKAKLDFIF